MCNIRHIMQHEPQLRRILWLRLHNPQSSECIKQSSSWKLAWHAAAATALECNVKPWAINGLRLPLCPDATVAQCSVMVQRAAALARVVRARARAEASAGAKRALKVFMRRVLHVKCSAGASASVGLGADAKKVAFSPPHDLLLY